MAMVNEIEGQIAEAIPQVEAEELEKYKHGIDRMAKDFPICKNAASATESVGKYVILGKVGAFNYDFPRNPIENKNDFQDWKKHHAYIDSLPPDERNAIASFTAGSSGKMNADWHQGTMKSSKLSIAMAKAHYGNKLRPKAGTIIKRNITVDKFTLDKLKTLPGYIIQEPAPNSCATLDGHFQEGSNLQIRMTLAHDAECIFVEGKSSNNGEKEVIMHPNCRMYIERFEPAGKVKPVGKAGYMPPPSTNVLPVIELPMQTDEDLKK